MPNGALDSLANTSNDKDIQDALKAEIEACMQKPGADPKSCAAMAYSTARKNTGKTLQSQK